MDDNIYMFSLYRGEERIDHGRIGTDDDDLDDVLIRFQAIVAYGTSLWTWDGKPRRYVLSTWRGKVIRDVAFMEAPAAYTTRPPQL